MVAEPQKRKCNGSPRSSPDAWRSARARIEAHRARLEEIEADLEALETEMKLKGVELAMEKLKSEVIPSERAKREAALAEVMATHR